MSRHARRDGRPKRPAGPCRTGLSVAGRRPGDPAIRSGDRPRIRVDSRRRRPDARRRPRVSHPALRLDGRQPAKKSRSSRQTAEIRTAQSPGPCRSVLGSARGLVPTSAWLRALHSGCTRSDRWSTAGKSLALRTRRRNTSGLPNNHNRRSARADPVAAIDPSTSRALVPRSGTASGSAAWRSATPATSPGRRKSLAPIRALGGRPSTCSADVHAGAVLSRRDRAKGHALLLADRHVAELTDELLSTGPRPVRRVPDPRAELGFLHLDGALNEKEEDDGAVGNREARYMIRRERLCGNRTSPMPIRLRQWIRAAWVRLHPFSTGATYINFHNRRRGRGAR